MAVFAAKGSHYVIIMDGVEGPKIDNLIFNVAGTPCRPATYWVNAPIPVIFSKDGAHWACMLYSPPCRSAIPFPRISFTHTNASPTVFLNVTPNRPQP